MNSNRDRQFTLPGIQDLNKDQKEAMDLPLEGQHLIIGGPGTGKSVVALLRARELAKINSENSNKRFRVLVYNNTLENSNRHLFGSDSFFSSETWEKWFYRIYKFFINKHVPKESNLSNSYQPIDWESIEKDLASVSLPPSEKLENCFIVIDEGQDMPPTFYEALFRFGFRNFFVVADQNQQISDNCSSREEIQNKLLIEIDDVIELKDNYRNTLPIARLARHFYPADPASPLPKLPEGKSTVRIPELWLYDEPGKPTLKNIIDSVLKMSDRFPSKLIAIITPNHKVREKFYNELKNSTPELENGKPEIQTYSSTDKNTLNFSIGSIMVINMQSCKGLEFDIVILADIDSLVPKDEYLLKSRLYVMVARAKEQIIILRTSNRCLKVEALLPTDSKILIRK